MLFLVISSATHSQRRMLTVLLDVSCFGDTRGAEVSLNHPIEGQNKQRIIALSLQAKVCCLTFMYECMQVGMYTVTPSTTHRF